MWSVKKSLLLWVLSMNIQTVISQLPSWIEISTWMKSLQITGICGIGRRSRHNFHTLRGLPAQMHYTAGTAESQQMPGHCHRSRHTRSSSCTQQLAKGTRSSLPSVPPTAPSSLHDATNQVCSTQRQQQQACQTSLQLDQNSCGLHVMWQQRLSINICCEPEPDLSSRLLLLLSIDDTDRWMNRHSTVLCEPRDKHLIVSYPGHPCKLVPDSRWGEHGADAQVESKFTAGGKIASICDERPSPQQFKFCHISEQMKIIEHVISTTYRQSNWMLMHMDGLHHPHPHHFYIGYPGCSNLLN